MSEPFNRILILIGIAVGLNLAATPASAHAFVSRYDLPLPLAFYLTAAGAAVVLSFVVIARFLKRRDGIEDAPLFNLLGLPLIRQLGTPLALNAMRSLSVTVFGLVLAAGLFGDPDTFDNIAPTFVWVVWWVGMAFASALVGNLWDLVNPWKILFTWTERALGGIKSPYAYPLVLSRWPAVLLFLLFAWLELISEQAVQPFNLAILIIAYSAITWTGMTAYGRDTWLENAEVFSAVFGLLAKFAPTVGAVGRWDIRLPAAGLLIERPVHISTVCFVLLLMTTITFDGILETPVWAGVLDRIAVSQALGGGLIELQTAGVYRIALVKSAALIVLPCLFVGVYFVFSHAIAMFGGSGRVSTRDVIGYFVLSLVPIAIAYHLSHYLSYLLISGQNIIPLASDPFGLGWDLFGTVAYRVDISIINAKMVWYIAVTTIVVGHVFAVYVAHVMAMRVFTDRGAALRSQIPMLVLMVGYTMVSLWILSQPIVN